MPLLLWAIADLPAAQTGPGFALHFDGAGGHVAIQNFLSAAPTNEVTVEFWQNANDLRPQSTFCQGPTPTGTNTGSVFNAHVPFVDGQVYWDFGDINAGGRLGYPPQAPIIGSWQHFAFVASQSGNYMAIYRNGLLEAFKTGMTPLVRANLDLDLSGAPSGLAFDGRLEEFRIWRVARTQDQIQLNLHRALNGDEPGLVACWHFNEGGANLAQDATGSASHTGLLNGGVSWEHSTAPFVPDVSTLAATLTGGVGGGGAQLHAWVNPDNLPTSAWFEWGSTPALGNQTFAVNVGSNSTPFFLSTTLGALNPGTKYYFRPMASNSGGLIPGVEGSLFTPMLSVTNSAVTNLYDDPDNPESLRYLIGHAIPNSGITIPPQLTGTIQLTNGPLPISSNLTLNGNCSVVIDGLGANRAFVPITNAVSVNGITFSNCSAANGGAIVVAAGGTFTATDCTFIGNSAGGLGGAISVTGSGTLVLNRCTLMLNQAVSGGAIDTFGDASLNSCTVVSNSASSVGGGLHLQAGIGTSLAVNHCTVAGNGAFSGGGLEDDAGTLTMQDSIIAGNTISGGSGPDVRNSVPGFASSGYNLIHRDDGSSGWKHSGLADDDLRGTVSSPLNPLLARLDDYGGCTCTMELLPGSPAIDTGASGGLSSDQRGFARPQNILGILSPTGDYSDIGAFEVQPTDLTGPPVLTILPAGTNVILLWGVEAKAYTLEQAARLAPTPAWSPVPATPVLTNSDTQLTVTRAASNSAGFYRLRAP